MGLSDKNIWIWFSDAQDFAGTLKFTGSDFDDQTNKFRQ